MLVSARKLPRPRLRVSAAMLLMWLTPALPGGMAQTLTTLYSFTGVGPRGTGNDPKAALILGIDGSLYSTTEFGGASGDGTVYRLAPPSSLGGAWTQTTILSFAGSADGSSPCARLAAGRKGALYGTTLFGGASGYGTVFQLIPPATGGLWTETVLHSFSGENGDGASPLAGVVLGANGALYGVTLGGGSRRGGTVFQLKPPSGPGAAWTETVLYSFPSFLGDGLAPAGDLTIGSNGALYGTTYQGGTGGGTAFELMPPAVPGGAWTETLLHSFAGGNDGYVPTRGLTFDPNGTIYGTTDLGGPAGKGTVFQLAPPSDPGGSWTETVLHSFTGQNGDGAYPQSALVLSQDASLYGTTYEGGALAGTGTGTVFQLVPSPTGGPWTEVVLHSFTGQNGDGAFPGAGLFPTNGVFYGTTNTGGALGYGAVFQLTP